MNAEDKLAVIDFLEFSERSRKGFVQLSERVMELEAEVERLKKVIEYYKSYYAANPAVKVSR